MKPSYFDNDFLNKLKKTTKKFQLSYQVIISQNLFDDRLQLLLVSMQSGRNNSWCMTSDQEVLGLTPSRRANLFAHID